MAFGLQTPEYAIKNSTLLTLCFIEQTFYNLQFPFLPYLFNAYQYEFKQKVRTQKILELKPLHEHARQQGIFVVEVFGKDGIDKNG